MENNSSTFTIQSQPEAISRLPLSIKKDIHDKILNVIREKKFTPRQLEAILSVPQPRVSELVNGRISNVSIAKLLTYLNRLGVEATMVYSDSNKAG